MKRFMVIGTVLVLMALVLAACPQPSTGGAATPTTSAAATDTPMTAATTAMTGTEATETPMLTGTAAMTGTTPMTGTPEATSTAAMTGTGVMTGTATATSTGAMTGTGAMTSTGTTTGTGMMTGTVMLATDPKLGKILTDGAGRTLYLFTNDTGSTSTCSGKCAANWPAFNVDSPKAGSGVDQALLSTSTGTDGKKQVTYNGHPLYYYIKDTKPGDTTGQGVGDVWYVVNEKGDKVESS
ncbi:MAG: hypothetical protein U0350_17170 [Caldilineaceae bacterium]